MDLGEARIEAKRRWAAHGGWADQRTVHRWDEKKRVDLEVQEYVVGVRRGESWGNKKVTLGRSRKSFEEAFSNAEAKILRDEQRRLKSRPAGKKKGPKGLPQEEIEWPR